MRISDWSSDVCSSDLPHKGGGGSTIRRRILELAKPRIIVRDAGGEIRRALFQEARHPFGGVGAAPAREDRAAVPAMRAHRVRRAQHAPQHVAGSRDRHRRAVPGRLARSEEHTYELQSLMRISYVVL